MKTMLTFIFSLFMIAASQADNGAYEKAMQKSLNALREAHDTDALTEAAHQFERIGTAEKDQWLPWYYAAYAHIMMGAIAQDPSQKDPHLDQAQTLLDKAGALKADASELTTLQGFLYMIRVTVDPASRGQEMAPRATQTLRQAVEMNPDNPRASLLLAQMQYGTAQFFQSDTSEACGLVTQALEKFETEKPKDSLMPTWGKETAMALQEQCD